MRRERKAAHGNCVERRGKQPEKVQRKKRKRKGVWSSTFAHPHGQSRAFHAVMQYRHEIIYVDQDYTVNKAPSGLLPGHTLRL
jgi:hypothetical protein